MGKKITQLFFLIFLSVIMNVWGQLCPTSTSVSLITNGDFESGNVGFSSGYTYYGSTTSGMGQGSYTVGSNPNIYNNTYYASMTDHNVTGTGKFLIVDVDGTLGKNVYATTATGIVPNTTYFFSAWFANIERMDNGNGNLTTCNLNTTTCPNGVIISNSPLMQFFVNGIAINTSLIRVDSLSNNWKQFSFAWNSGTISGSAFISIQNLRGSGNSNDLGIDEVGFSTSCSLVTNLNSIGKTSAVPSIVSLCAGGGAYNMNPQLSTVYGTIWKNSGGTTLSTASTYTVSTTGTYYLCYDTIPGCYRSDTVSVVNTLSVNIGNNQNLCNPVSTTLLTGVSVPPCSVTWFLNGTKIPGATGANYFVNTVGTYFAVVSAPGCAVATSNGVNITSSAATPNNTTYCGTSTVNLSVSPANSGKYKWWSDPTATGAGFLLQKGGSSYNLAVSGTANFIVYAQDTSAYSGIVYPTNATGFSTAGYGAGNAAVVFTPSQNFSILSMQIPIGFSYIPPSGTSITITVQINNSGGTSITTATSLPVFFPSGSSNSLYTFSFTGLNVSSSWGSNLSMIVGSSSATNGASYYVNWYSSGTTAYPYASSPAGVLSITGAAGPYGIAYGSFLNWQIQVGNPCARIPVIASSTCALDISYVNLFAYRKGADDLLNWQFNGLDFNSYSIQRSSDGIAFSDLVSFSSEQKDITSYATSNTGFPSAYYRIKVINQNNKESFSRVQYVSGSEASLYSSLFPNPSQGGDAKIVSNFSMYGIEIIDRSGKQVFSFDLGGVNEYQLSSNLSQGVYFVRITGLETTKVISWVVLP